MPAQTSSQVTVQKIQYRSWPDSLILSNGKVEAVIVPAIGRVMQFRFAGEEDGPFWENADLFGKSPDPKSSTWGNFGGDKTWPAPQSEWPKITPRSWPPPQAFDSMPVTVEFKHTVLSRMVELVSPVDPHFGIRTRRLIQLNGSRPQMTITTTYEKVEGNTVTVGVWIITQLKDPQAVHIPTPKDSIFAKGYTEQSKQLPAGLKRQGRLLSLVRDSKASTKIGTDASSLLWIGDKYTLRIDSPRLHKQTYPDQGSSAEVYTNPDPLTYVELEMLGPLKTMKVGDRIKHTNTYTLSHK
ncbi:MAG TPA: hypothetical protein PLD20_20295 [Blastocatellia bacterium]|nr:hypothetical protein [Blastocatellia bacterium]HMX27813.1 hypothetical protein [Blastocatellia bacterium]HMY73497.1 hypothetical protein [Blastocatellia bacterium]HMZ20288.1 hypothetical protein [Blastocatellia bacterium]HNG32546.1 hypothetical protein [Blastocatellia bacterium]